MLYHGEHAQEDLEQCSSDGHYAVVGSQRKDAPPAAQPYEVPAKYIEIRKKQVCVSLLRVLKCLLVRAWLLCAHVHIYVHGSILFVFFCVKRYTIVRVYRYKLTFK